MRTVGLAGKPNAGKSTFFRAATLADAETGNYPFTTIDANRGVAAARTECPCLALDERCPHCRDGARYVPVELLDVAGLVPGAHEGRGLGNQFLDELRQADAILHVVDAAGATDPEGEPLEVGDHDPTEDVAFLEGELDAWIAGVLRDNWDGMERRSKTPDFELEPELVEVLSGVGATEPDVRRALRRVDPPETIQAWTDEEIEAFATAIRDEAKPILIAANKADVAPPENLEALDAVAAGDEGVEDVVPTSARYEHTLRQGDAQGVIEYRPGDDDFAVVGDLNDDQAAGLETIREYLAEHGGTGVQAALNAAVYDVLDMITAYPVEDSTNWRGGEDDEVLPDAHLLPRGSTPRDLAYAIHGDIGEGYLHAVDARTDQRISDETELEEGAVIEIVSTA